MGWCAPSGRCRARDCAEPAWLPSSPRHRRHPRRAEPRCHAPRTVVVATGLTETLPALPSIRAWYGTDLHSCIDCDGYEKADAALALIGESDDLAERALLISQWSDDLIVFTNGVGCRHRRRGGELSGRAASASTAAASPTSWGSAAP